MSETRLQTPDATRADAVRDEFQALTGDLMGRLEKDEQLLCGLRGEDSDFVRFNHGQVRQAGSVTQRAVSLHLLKGRRHAEATVSLTGDRDADTARLRDLLGSLRERLPHVPEDPFLNHPTRPADSERRAEGKLPTADAAVRAIQDRAGDRDLVGVYASGAVYAAHRNSLGQTNWYDNRSFNFDWSFYHSGDKAVKTGYAGFEWDEAVLDRKFEIASRQFDVLNRKPRRIQPGSYRVYLAPAAMQDILGLVSWGGFGLRARKTRQSPLLKLALGEEELSPAVRISEHTAEGIAPDFQEEGFHRPAEVPLVAEGKMLQTLVSPRSEKEYGVPTNGAGAAESPESLEMAAGDLPTAAMAERLGTGLWIGNVWYLNYSDRAACRTTGMTRFATFWVEDGEIVAPVDVMRFDETVYRMLGDNLVGLTAEREMILDPATYFVRQLSSAHVPGALVEDFRLTL